MAELQKYIFQQVPIQYLSDKLETAIYISVSLTLKSETGTLHSEIFYAGKSVL